MSPIEIGLLIALVTILLLATGMSIAFGLGLAAVGFLLVFQGPAAFSILAEKFFGGIASFTLVALPMFILMGAAVASSPAGRDLYLALDRWMNRVPGGIIISNLAACSIFAALSGSSPATCAAIGKMGIPEMRKRGVPDDLATGVTVSQLLVASGRVADAERVLATLVEAYENKHYPLDLPDPVEAIRFRMEQKGMTPKDLVPMIGQINRVYEVLNRRRPLTLAMIQRLHNDLGIPAESLIKQRQHRRAA